MRWHTGPVALLFAWVALQCSIFASPLGGQTRAGFQSPKEPFLTYFDAIVLPAAKGQALTEDTLRSFYISGLSAETRASFSEDQFVDYWSQLKSPGRLGYIKTVKYEIIEPVESEARDQALIFATVSVDYNPGAFPQIIDFLSAVASGLGCLPFVGSASTCNSSRSYQSSSSSHESSDVVYRVLKESDGWKLVLPEAAANEIRKVMPRVAARHYHPGTAASDHGVTVQVLEVALEKDATTLRLSIRNATDSAVPLLLAFASTTLTDDAGKAYTIHMLRSTFPETLQPQGSASATLVFEPAPLGAKKFLLLLPRTRVGDETASLTLDITLAPLPSPKATYTPIPGEPVIFYLAALRRVRFSPPYLQDEPLKGFYQTYLASESQIEVSEREFVDYIKGHFRSLIGFAIGVPVYNPSRDHASLQVTTTWEQIVLFGPNTRTDTMTLSVVKEGTAWKLVLPEEIIQDIQRVPPDVTTKRYASTAAVAAKGVTFRVQEVVLGRTLTTLQLSVENDTDSDVNLFAMSLGTTLTDRLGKTYATRYLHSTLPEKVNARSAVTGSLAFEPLPIESRRFLITIRDLRIDDNTLILPLDVRLKP